MLSKIFSQKPVFGSIHNSRKKLLLRKKKKITALLLKNILIDHFQFFLPDGPFNPRKKIVFPKKSKMDDEEIIKTPPLSPKRPIETFGRSKTSFSTNPSSLLQNLNSKIGGNYAAEAHRVKSELISNVQTISNKQEIQIRQIDSQLSMLQQELKPKLQTIERQQGFAQKLIDELRAKVTKLQTDDLATLKYKYDQMSARFDRFMKVEIENKLNPIQDDLRQSKAQLEELNSTSLSNFRKINDQINELTEKIQSLSGNLDSQQIAYDDQLLEIEPKLNNLEEEMNDLAELIGNPLSGAEDIDGMAYTQESLEKQLKDAHEAVEKLKNDTIPSSIQDNSSNFIEALHKITQFCDDKIVSLQSKLDSISCSNQVVDQQKKQAEDQLDQLLKISFDVQNKIRSLDQDSKAQLSKIEQFIESNSSNIKSMVEDLANESSDENEQERIDQKMLSLRENIQTSIKKLRNNIKLSSQANYDAQSQAFQQISTINNYLYGSGNAIGRISVIEERVKWCMKFIQDIDDERLKIQEHCGSPQNVATRIASIEDRLHSLDTRLIKIEKDL